MQEPPMVPSGWQILVPNFPFDTSSHDRIAPMPVRFNGREFAFEAPYPEFPLWAFCPADNVHLTTAERNCQSDLQC